MDLLGNLISNKEPVQVLSCQYIHGKSFMVLARALNVKTMAVFLKLVPLCWLQEHRLSITFHSKFREKIANIIMKRKSLQVFFFLYLRNLDLSTI